ncbi:MAG: NADH-quinone oxidoreductase subunit C [Lachnospiraceae bacterium]|nr:NADH-quinone oxidoreductase subunit C [Lachnospiraceae bacterium]
MAEVVKAANDIVPVDKEDLMETANIMKHKGRRVSQICASLIDGKYEILYSFADDENYDYTSYKVTIDPEVHVPSITAIFPNANFYENEMAELYGVKVDYIDGDYHNKLYRIKEVAPFGPKKEEAK